jgi:hypothetical protein
VALRKRQAAERLEADRELLPAALRAWAQRHDGRAPTVRERDQELRISERRAKLAFGSWRELVLAAGLEPRETGQSLRDTRGGRLLLRGANRQTVTGVYGAADGSPSPKVMRG